MVEYLLITEMKICSRCKDNKPLTEFNKCKSCKDGHHPQCKTCKRHYRVNDPNLAEKQHSYYIANKDKLLVTNRQYRLNNAETITEQRKGYREQNKEHIAKKNKEYVPIRCLKIKERRKNDPCFRIREQMRTALHRALKKVGGKNGTSAVQYLGCEIQLFREWIEFQLDSNMSWENYGTEWDIDHILAVNRFDMMNIKHRQICFNWTNMQPLSKKENIAKLDRLHLHHYFNSVVNVHRFIQNKKTLYQGYQSVRESLHWLRIELRYGKNPLDEAEHSNVPA
jgi:hypothetical protein